MLLEDRVAIVTGAAMGMGRATALKFADEGCNVVVADIVDEDAEKTVADITRKGRQAVFAHCDITDKGQIKEMVDKAIGTFGKIDILVNNAGGTCGTQRSDIETADEDDWDLLLKVNLKGAFMVCKAVVPHMKKAGYGKIINLSSMGAVNPSVSVLHYHAAKAGILGLTINLAFELAPQGIYVNAIVPGPIRTPFWNGLTEKHPDPDAFFAALAKKEVPLGRMGTAEDIAGPALFLASGLSDYVTGQIICAAGGQPLLSHEATMLSASKE